MSDHVVNHFGEQKPSYLLRSAEQARLAARSSGQYIDDLDARFKYFT